MNEQTPEFNREELEARLTALLLGELSEAEASSLREELARDAALAKMYRQLEQTIALVRETAGGSAEEVKEPAQPLRLSEGRRQKLLQHFKTISPKEFVRPRKSRAKWMLELSAAAAAILILASLTLPSLNRAKTRSMAQRDLLSHQDLAEFRRSYSTRDLVGNRKAQPPFLAVPPNPSNVDDVFFVGRPVRTPSKAQDSGVSNIVLPAAAVSGGVFASGGSNVYSLNIVGYAHVPTSAAAPASTPLAVEAPLSAQAATREQQALADTAPAALFKTPVALPPPAAAPEGQPTESVTESAPSAKLTFDDLNRNAGAPPAGSATATSSIGDPQWIGILGQRNSPHGNSNAFVASYAFAGDSLSIQDQLKKSVHEADTPIAGSNYEAQKDSQKRQLGVFLDGSKVLPAQTAGPSDIVASPQQASAGAIEPATGLPLQIRDKEEAIQLDTRHIPTDTNAINGRWAVAQPSSAPAAGSFLFYQQPSAGGGGGGGGVGGRGGEFSNAAVTNGTIVAGVNLDTDAGQLRSDTGKLFVPAPSEKTDIIASPAMAGDEPLQAGGTLALAENKRLAEGKNKTGNGAELDNATRKLGELERFQKLVELKLNEERKESSSPGNGPITVVDRAQAPARPNKGLWNRLLGKNEYAADARVRVERDQTDIAGFEVPKPATGYYDPYFIQTEFELIKSDAVLDKVVKDLNLDQAWSKKAGPGKALTRAETVKLLKQKLELSPVRNTELIDIKVSDGNAQEAAEIANTIAQEYAAYTAGKQRRELAAKEESTLQESLQGVRKEIAAAQQEVAGLESRPAANSASRPASVSQAPAAAATPALAPPVAPQPEVQSKENAFSTFSMNVSDVSFKLASASLEAGKMPVPASVRSEEFINAFDYRDPEAPPGAPVAFAFDRARYPFAQNRDVLRFSIKTAAEGREPGRPLNLVLLLDTSGSMERADRVRIVHEALRVLAEQLRTNDTLSVVTFARTARLWVDGVSGAQAGKVAEQVGSITPEGGTNLEEAMKLAYQTALRHYASNGINRVVLMTDGAANLGNVAPAALKQKVEAHRQQGISLDCFGIGWEGYNDELLETLTRTGNGRYGFLNAPEEAANDFAGQLAGALRVAAADVKVQVEFNPNRVTAYRQIGYAKHQLTKEQFRDNSVTAAQFAAAESGNALYVIEVNPRGEGPLGVVRVRYRTPATREYHEHEWPVPYTGSAPALPEATPALRLATTAASFAEWLAGSPYAAEVTPERLLEYLRGVPEICGADARPKQLEWMIRQAQSLEGKK